MPHQTPPSVYFQAATHMLEQKELFIKWMSHNAIAKWHRKWFTSPASEYAINSLYALTVGASFFQAFSAFPSSMGIASLLVSAVASALWLVRCVDGQEVVAPALINPLMTLQSNTFGVRFKGSARQMWAVCSAEEKLALLNSLNAMDESWNCIKSQLLDVLQTDQLPSVWWMSIQNLIDAELALQIQKNQISSQQQQLAQMHNQMHNDLHGAVKVENETPPESYIPSCNHAIRL